MDRFADVETVQMCNMHQIKNQPFKYKIKFIVQFFFGIISIFVYICGRKI